MRYVKEFAVVLALLMLAGCAGKPVQESPVATDEGIPAGQIYLYGEIHGIAAIEEYEAERWKECYERGMRHLFVELSHYTAQWLNLWMDAEDDEILEQLHQDWESTLSSGAETLDFYRTIKEQCPETVFHGTDVGHQYDSTGARYQDYLEERGLADTEDYRLTLEAIQQGKTFAERGSDIYRENRMAENFIREFDALDGESVMGIYGAAHTDPDAHGGLRGNRPLHGRSAGRAVRGLPSHRGHLLDCLGAPADGYPHRGGEGVPGVLLRGGGYLRLGRGLPVPGLLAAGGGL